jgi:hypothetical protein
MKDGIMAQFYKMTIEKAVEGYSQGLLTATGLVHLYFEIKLKYGWKGRYKPTDIIAELGISKPAFYKAIAKLQTLGMISIEIHGEITVTNTNPNLDEDSILEQSTKVEKVSNRRQESPIVDKILQMETEVSDRRQKSLIVENEAPKPKPLLNSSPPSDLYSDSYQIYLISLSEGERKNFLNFCQEEAKTLPKPPTLPMRWIERNLEDLKAKWESFNGVKDDNIPHQSNKFSVWANHPRFDELWQGVCQHGTTGYVIQNIRDTTIKDFCKFCHESKEIMEEILSCLNSH